MSFGPSCAQAGGAWGLTRRPQEARLGDTGPSCAPCGCFCKYLLRGAQERDCTLLMAFAPRGDPGKRDLLPLQKDQSGHFRIKDSLILF